MQNKHIRSDNKTLHMSKYNNIKYKCFMVTGKKREKNAG